MIDYFYSEIDKDIQASFDRINDTMLYLEKVKVEFEQLKKEIKLLEEQLKDER